MSRIIQQGFAKLMPTSMIAILVSSLFLFTAVNFQTAQPALAAADDYTVTGGDINSAMHVGAASVALPTLTMTDVGGDDFSDVDTTEIFDIVINTSDFSPVIFDTSVVFGDLTVGGTCGHTSASALTYTGTTTAHVTVTGAAGAATCAAGETITINGLKIEVIYSATVSGGNALVTVDNATTSAGSAVATSDTSSFITTAPNASASAVMADPIVAAVGDTTLTLTTPFALDADDTVVMTFPAQVDVSGVDAAVTGTFESAANITCAAAGQIVTCTTDGATLTTGTIIMTGITNAYVASTDISKAYVYDEGVTTNLIAGTDNAALTNAIAADAAATVTLADPLVGAVQDTTLDLTVPLNLVTGDTIDITFPAHIDVSGVDAAVTGTFESASDITCAAAGQVVTCTENNNGATLLTGTLIMTGITASAGGTADVSSVQVESGGVASRDMATDSTVATTDTVLGALAATSVGLSSTLASASSTATIAMTLATTLPNDGIIEVTFPAGFDLTGVTSAVSVGGFDGTFVAVDSGQVLTITRQGDGNPTTASSAIALDVGFTVNPGAAGLTSTFAFETQNSATASLDADATVAGVTITTTTTTTTTSGGGGGGGGGGSSANTSNTASNSTTSTATANIGTITGDQTYSSPLKFSEEDIVVDSDNNTAKIILTANGSLTLKPNSGSTISAYFPPNTEVTGPANWDGKIDPPLIKSITTIPKDGEKIEGSNDMLMRSDVEVIVKVGANVPLTFSNEVTLEIPLNLVDGSVVQLYTSEDGNTWVAGAIGVVKDGKLVIKTDHFSYFAVVPTEDSMELPDEDDGFADIVGHWAENFVNEIADLGIVSGKSATIYAPNDNITRAELTKIATKAFSVEIDPSPTFSPFGDVALSAWYAPFVIAARDAGIVEGVSEGIFSPNASITRAAALKIVLESAGFGETTAVSDFDDVPTSAWFSGYVSFGSQNGIVSGYADGSFGPGNYITRAEVAKIVVKVMELKDTL